MAAGGLHFHLPTQYRQYDLAELRNLRFFAHPDVRVPDVLGHRAVFLAELTPLVEMELAKPGVDEPRDPMTEEDPGFSQWIALLDKLVAYWLDDRKEMSADHRLVIWTNICRIRFVTHRDDSEYRRVFAESTTLAEFYVTMRDVPVSDQSLRTFTSHIFLLVARWNDMPLTPDVLLYVESIWSRMGFFAWTTEADEALFNHTVYSETIGSIEHVGVISSATGKVEFSGQSEEGHTCFAVTPGFLTETERIMSVIIRDYLAWTRHRGDAPRAAPRLTQLERFRAFAYLDSILDTDARRDGVAVHFIGRIYPRRMVPGEDERAGVHIADDSITPQTAVLSERQDISDTVQELLDTPTHLRDLLDAAKGAAGDVRGESASAAAAAPFRQVRASALRKLATTADADDIVMCILATMIDGAMSHEEFGLFDYFTAKTLPVPRSLFDIPVFVRTAARWHVSFKGVFYTCDSVEQAIVQWLTFLCGSVATVQSFERFTSDISAIYGIYKAMIGKASPAEISAARPTQSDFDIVLPSVYE